jgi:hypothetical protein
MLESRLQGSRIDRFRAAASVGDALVTGYVPVFLSLAIEYLAPLGKYYGVPSFVTIDARRYQFLEREDPYVPDAIDFHLLPYAAPVDDPLQPAANIVSFDVVHRFQRARLFAPKGVKGFNLDLALSLIDVIVQSGYRWITTFLREIVPAFGANLGASLYGYIRREVGQGNDRHFILATLPRGPGGQIIYLVDEPKIDQLLNSVTERAQGIRESPLKLAGEFMKNNVEWERIHAKHAIQRDKPTDFDLNTSKYLDDHDVFTQAEIGWYGSDQITIFPFLNTSQEALMAVSATRDRERVQSELHRLRAGLEERFHRYRDEAVEQLEVLNGLADERIVPIEEPAAGRNRGTSVTLPTKKIYVSYAWTEESEKIVGLLESSLQARGTIVRRDKREILYRASIQNFMREMGQGDRIILIVSKDYLESKYCMFELIEIANRGDLRDRVCPIILRDADMYKAATLLKYIKYWEDELQKLDAAMKTVQSDNLQGIREEIDLYRRIRTNFAEIVATLQDMNALTPEMHKENNFQDLYDCL